MENVIDYSVANLKIHPRNNEFFDDISGSEYEQFKTSIQNEGVLTPLIIAPDLTIISGHQRYKAAKELEFEMVPVIIRHDIQTEDEKIIALLAANFGRNKNDEKKQRKVAKEYTDRRGIKGGGRAKLSPMGKVKLTQEQIAKELGISVSELNRMIDIETKLTPEIIKMLDEGVFTKNTAARVLTQLTKDEQADLITTYGKEIIEGVTQKQMQEYVDKIQGLENVVAGYEMKLATKQTNDEGSDDNHVEELIKERDELQLKYRNQYEKSQLLKIQLEEEKKKGDELPDDYVALKDELSKLKSELELQKTLNENLLIKDNEDANIMDHKVFNGHCTSFLSELNYFKTSSGNMSRSEKTKFIKTIETVEQKLGEIKKIIKGDN